MLNVVEPAQNTLPSAEIRQVFLVNVLFLDDRLVKLAEDYEVGTCKMVAFDEGSGQKLGVVMLVKWQIPPKARQSCQKTRCQNA